MARIIDGSSVLAYRGVKPVTPPNMIVPGNPPFSAPRNPTEADINYNLGDFWLNSDTEQLWILVFLGSHLVGSTNTRYATWIEVTGAGTVQFLEGNNGGPVGPDVNGIIHTIGDVASGIVVNGNPGTNTLTWTSSGGGHFGETETGDVGGAVPFDAAGNLNVVGAAGSGVVVTGTPGTNTLAIGASGGGHFGETLTGDAGGAVSFDVNGNIDTLGAHGINTLGNPGANSMTFAINNTITLGDLAVVAAGADALTVTSGNVTLSGTGANAAGNINIPDTTTDARQGIINFGGTRFISNFGTANTFVGENSGNTTLTGTTNTAIGFEAGLSWTTASGATAVGHMALTNNTGAGGNDAFGTGALQNCTTGGSNSCIGALSCQDITTGSFNTSVGVSSMNSITTGLNNVAVGYLALASLTTGGFNTAIGQEAGDGLTTTDSNNVMINNTGTVGDNNTLRIGAGAGTGQGQLNRAFIHGIRGITTGVNDAIAVLIDSAGQLGTVSSSIRYKENVEDLGLYSNDLYRLRPVRFNYKQHPSIAKSIGLIAEEVMEVYPDLVVKDSHGCPETVKYQDLPVLLLNELQRHQQVIEHLLNRIEDLERALG